MNPIETVREQLISYPLSRRSRFFFKFLFFTVCLAPFVFLAVRDCVLTYREMTETTMVRRQAFARLTAITLEGKLDNARSVGVALADSHQMRSLVAAGRWAEAMNQVRNVPSDFSYIERLGLVDASGQIQAVYPPIAGVVGRFRDNRDWYKGVIRTHAPYISEVYALASDPSRLMVSCSVPIKQTGKGLAGILNMQIPVTKLTTWADDVDVGPEGFVYFVDQYGHRIGHPYLPLLNSLSAFPPDAPIQRVLHGERGVQLTRSPRDNTLCLTAYEPISDGWGVMVEQPARRAFFRRNEILQSMIVFYSLLLLGVAFLAYAFLLLVRALQRNKEELREFMDHMSTMSAKVALDGKIMMANKTAELASGLSRSELEKAPFLLGPWWSFDPEVQARVIKNFDEAVRGNPVQYDERIMLAGVGPVDINFSLTPVKDEGDVVRYIVAEGRDITPIKKTEQALAHAQRVGRLGSWEWNMTTHRIRWSSEFARVLNLKTQENEMSWESFQALCPADAYFLLEMLKKYIDKREPFSANRSYDFVNGITRWLQWSGEAFFDANNKLVRMAGTVQDITELKTAEEQRWLLVEEQRRRVEAEKDQQRTQFLAQAALLLSSSLDYEQTLERLAKMLTVRFADWCAIYLINEDETLHRVLATQEGISKADERFGGQEQRLSWEKASELLIQTIKSEKSQHVAIITDKVRSGFENDHIHLVMSEYFGFQSVMFVPMLVRGRILGVIEFVLGKSKKRYDHEDVSLAEELTHYASVAIENARLYKQAIVAQERANNLASIVENSEDAIVGKSLDGVIASWNDGAQRMYGYTAEEIVGLPISVLAPPDKKEEMKQVLERIKKGESIDHFESVRRRKNGSLMHVSLAVSPIKNTQGELIGASSIARDISEKKLYEDGLAKARDMALESARVKSEFVANVSHEIRTPMNGVIGMMGLLLNSKLTAKQRDYAETVRTSCDSLLTIINDILDFSKIEASQMRLEIQDFDLQNVIDNTMEFLAPRAHFKNLELLALVAHDVPVALRGDPGRLSQILMNLIGNAIKFTQQGEVMVRIAKQEESQTHLTVLVSVTDTGVGIPADRQSQLFQPFSQADNSVSRKFGGTGLGLALSKRFVELMGGEIGLQSEAGHGSTFWFKVTLEKQRAVAGKGKSAADFSDLRVLVACGSGHVADVVVHQMQPWRFKAVDCARDQEQARAHVRAAAKTDPYNLVILDRQTTGGDSLAFAKYLTSSSEFPSPRVILLTTMDQPLDSHVLRETGISVCLTKPFKAATLVSSFRGTNANAGEKRMKKERHHETSGSSRKKRPHLLVVEDNSINQKVILLQLEQLGYGADSVANGMEAIKAWEQIPYDMILMDCQMPDMDGYAATEAIRRREAEGKHVPIIAMTAHVMVGDREKCLAAGMDDYIPKPIKTENLQSVLAKWHPASEADDGPVDPLKDPEFVREVSALFLKETPSYLRTMKKAFKAKDAAEWRAAAHSVAGSCCIVGTKEMKVLCQNIEEKAEGGRLDEAAPLFKKLEAEFTVVEKMLSSKSGRKRHEDTYRG
jgi:PAS domain S-box-containing protein